jgi:hypothetical protein
MILAAFPESVLHLNGHVSTHVALEPGQNHIQARREIVIELLALTCVAAGGLHFLFAPLKIEASEFSNGFIPFASLSQLGDVYAELLGFAHRLFERPQRLGTFEKVAMLAWLARKGNQLLATVMCDRRTYAKQGGSDKLPRHPNHF